MGRHSTMASWCQKLPNYAADATCKRRQLCLEPSSGNRVD